jgi:amino acid permease
MIIVKILLNGRAVKRAGARSFTRPAFHLLLESAAICCVCLIITPVLILLKNCGTNLMLEVTPMIFVRMLFLLCVMSIYLFVAGPKLLGDHYPGRARHCGARQ